MSKGDTNTKTKTTTEPWSGVKPYLISGYKDAQSLYNQGAPGYYPGQTVAPMSSYSKQALDSMAQRAAYGSNLTRSAQAQLQKTINGDYLNGNPYLSKAIDTAVRPVREAFSGEVMPGIDSNFSAAGRYGSGLQGAAYNDANDTLARQIGDIGTNMSYQNYGDERQRQIQAMLFAPEMASQDYRDISMLGQAGAGYDQYNQNLINADMAKYNYNQNAQWNMLNDYIGLLNGATGGSTTTSQPQQGVGPVTGALGGALSGASLGSAFGPWGTAIGGILGGVGGAFA